MQILFQSRLPFHGEQSFVFGCAIALLTCVLSMPAAFAAPFVTGSASNGLTKFFWEVYDDAGDNPRPSLGEFTYLYWQEITGAFNQKIYWVRLLGPQPPDQLGAISTTGFIPNTGVAPSQVSEGDWRWNFPQGATLVPGQRTASLFVNSPDPPGTIAADIANCNPFLCFYPTTSIVGPTLIPADFDHSGTVDRGDLEWWEDSFGTNGLADADGDSDGADLLEWQRQYDGDAATAVAVPEPASLASSLVLAALAIRVRRLSGCRAG